MKSFIESLYYGEISPCSMPVPNTKRYIEAQKELGKYETELLTTACPTIRAGGFIFFSRFV